MKSVAATLVLVGCGLMLGCRGGPVRESGAESGEARGPLDVREPAPDVRAAHEARIKTLYDRSYRLFREGAYDPRRLVQSLAVAQEVVRLRTEVLGADHVDTALAVGNVGLLLVRLERYREARVAYERVLEAVEREAGPDHPLTAEALAKLGEAQRFDGDLDAADKSYQRSLHIVEKHFGPWSPKMLSPLMDRALWYDAVADYARGEAVLLRALAVAERAFGSRDLRVAVQLRMLARHYQDRGDFPQAEEYARKAMSVIVDVRGPNHPDVGLATQELAEVQRARGDYDAAERSYHRAMRLYIGLQGTASPLLISPLNQLIMVYVKRGDLAAAEDAARRALALQTAATGKDSAPIVGLLGNLAAVLAMADRGDEARALIEREVALARRLYGDDSSAADAAVGTLSTLLFRQGALERAEALTRERLKRATRDHGDQHPERAMLLRTLGDVVLARGDLNAARQALEEAARIMTRSGFPSPGGVKILNGLTRLAWIAGDLAGAESRLAKAIALDDQLLATALAYGSERQKLMHARDTARTTSRAISLALRPGASASAVRLAAQTILRRKGVVLDLMGQTVQAARAGAQDERILKRLAERRSQLAGLAIRGPGAQSPDAWTAMMRELAAAIRKDEASLAAGAAPVVALQPVTLESVQRQLGPGEVLIELVSYRPWSPKQATVDYADEWAPTRYLACVIRASGTPVLTDLGPTEALDGLVERLGRAASNPDYEVEAIASGLATRALAPLDLSGAEGLVLSPDGGLTLVPWAVLPLPDGRLLGDALRVRLVTSGRDLVANRDAAPRGAPLIVADPAFSNDPLVAGKGRRSLDLTSMSFDALSGTRLEAEALGRLMPDARVRTGSDASEPLLAGVHGPLLVHVATHGFFLGPRAVESDPSARLDDAEDQLLENPLLRSGLALAGAVNARGSGAGDDGILTALEASSLDLRGTRLVVLSACETGVGTVRAGSGVCGLQRALLMAGAQSLVTSLWKVDDGVTRDLMIAFYRRLAAGVSRAEALRQAQRAIRDNPETEHPFYWAAFQLIGADGPVMAP